MRGVHVVAYEMANGPVPPGLYVLHKCLNCRHCCNPAHLYAGTAKDNTDDRERDGHTARGDRSGSRLHPERVARGDRHSSKTQPHRQARGERINTAKLTAEKVTEIRVRVAAGESMSAMAREYGVSADNVFKIVHRRYWKHVP